MLAYKGGVIPTLTRRIRQGSTTAGAQIDLVAKCSYVIQVEAAALGHGRAAIQITRMILVPIRQIKSRGGLRTATIRILCQVKRKLAIVRR